ncbi:MAG: hypothetical protein O2895_04770 [Chloroflexi bacterium]|nr:hypothetical protein [Chloroflexota bacterium]
MDLSFLAVLVGTPAAIGAAGYVAKRFVDGLFEAGTRRFEIQTQAFHDMELERLRVQLGMAAFEHQTRFARLHERRFDVLNETYVRLVAAHRAFHSLTAPLQLAGEPPEEVKAKEAADAGNEFIKYFEENRIWLPGEICDDIDGFARMLRNVGVDFSMRKDLPEAWRQIRKAMTDDVPRLKRSIEERARTLIDPMPAPAALDKGTKN